MLKGIDINPFKADLDLDAIQFDFVITKATGGVGYVNPDCDPKVQKAISKGKLWGVFHYFGDGFNDNDPIEEADYFLANVVGYIGHGLLALDWERGGNPNVNRVDMALAWLNRVYEKTGVKCPIYMNYATYMALDWTPVIAAGYALWLAFWPDNNNIIANYAMNPARDPNPRWDGVVGDVIWQFTSTGRLDGYEGNLDCDFFYGDGNTWMAYATPAGQATPVPPTTTTTTTAAPETPPTTTTQAPPDPAPTPDPTPPLSTTTTTTIPVGATTTAPPVADRQATWLAVIWSLFITIIKRLQGKVK